MNWKIALIASLTSISMGCLEVTPQTLCSTDADCFEGYTCDAADSRSCLRACDPQADGQCLSSETCTPTSDDSENGVCKPSSGDGDEG